MLNLLSLERPNEREKFKTSLEAGLPFGLFKGQIKPWTMEENG